MKPPVFMTTVELIRWIKSGGDRSIACRILANRFGEAYAVSLLNKVCGGRR